MQQRSSLAPFIAGLLAALLLGTACSHAANNGAATNASSGMAASESSAPPAAAGAAGNNAQLYLANCSSCHQANGRGVVGAFPPLAGNATVTGDPKTVIHIVKYGLTGKVQVANGTYDGTMPPWGGQLSDAAIASVVSYIRTSWGNAANGVTAADVRAVAR